MEIGKSLFCFLLFSLYFDFCYGMKELSDDEWLVYKDDIQPLAEVSFLLLQLLFIECTYWIEENIINSPLRWFAAY